MIAGKLDLYLLQLGISQLLLTVFAYTIQFNAG